jgi:hypothetical protein
MMNCEQFKENILEFLYDEVPSTEREAMLRHLQSCAACTAEANEIKLVRNELAEWKDPAARSFPITPPYPSPLALLTQWLLPHRWTWRSMAAFAAVASVFLLVAFAVVGTQIEISKGRFAFRADLLRHSVPANRTANLGTPQFPQTGNVISPVSASRDDMTKAELLREVSQMIQESEGRQQQLMKSEEMRLVNELTAGYRTQLAGLAKTIDNRHRLDLATIYDNLEQQRLADLQKIRLTFSSFDERTSQQARQTQQLVDLFQNASYQPK